MSWKLKILIIGISYQISIKGGLKESHCGYWGVGYVSEGNVGAKQKGEAHKLLPLLNGRVWQLEHGACIYEN